MRKKMNVPMAAMLLATTASIMLPNVVRADINDSVDQMDVNETIYEDGDVATEETFEVQAGRWNSDDEETAAIDLADCVAWLNETSFAYTGDQVCPTVHVRYNGVDLVEGYDYSVEYGRNIEIGTGTIEIVGQNGFKGIKQVTFEIRQADISNSAEIQILDKTNADGVYAFSGKAIEPAYEVRCGSSVLSKDKDYTIKFERNKEAGTALATITGCSAVFSGTITKTFEIKPCDILDSKIKVAIASERYTGFDCRPKVNINYGEYILKEDEDFSVSYSNNREVGTGRVVITGKGNFAGTRNASFEIADAVATSGMLDINSVKIKVKAAKELEFTGGKYHPQFIVKSKKLKKTLIKDVDYTILYDEGVNAGKHYVTIMGKGDFYGQTQVAVKIKPLKLKDYVRVEAIKDTIWNGSPETVVPKVYLKKNDIALEYGKDFTVKCRKNKKPGQATCIIKGKGNFKGKIKINYNILPIMMQ